MGTHGITLKYPDECSLFPQQYMMLRVISADR